MPTVQMGIHYRGVHVPDRVWHIVSDKAGTGKDSSDSNNNDDGNDNDATDGEEKAPDPCRELLPGHHPYNTNGRECLAVCNVSRIYM